MFSKINAHPSLSRFAITALAATTIGCVAENEEVKTTDALDTITMNLEATDGGITETDEREISRLLDIDFSKPAFDIPSRLRADENGSIALRYTEAADRDQATGRSPSGAANNNEELRKKPNVRGIYSVRVAWGQLQGDPLVRKPTVWRSAAKVNVGAVEVARTIRFEEMDQVIPQTEPNTTRFRSVTGPHFDGVVLRVVDVESPLAVVHELSLELGDHELRIPIRDLDGYRAMRVVDGAGNRIAVQAMREDTNDCQKGMLAGRFRRIDERGGKFAGRYTSADRTFDGFLMGVYGKRRNGEEVIFGKFIAHDGSYRGRLIGTYENDDLDSGTFHGRWIGRGGEDRGLVKAQYREGKREGRGFFQGRWANKTCQPTH